MKESEVLDGVQLNASDFDANENDGYLFVDFYKVAAIDWDDVHAGQTHNSREFNSWLGLNIIRLIMAVWIIASHIAINVFILVNRILRNQSKNTLIVSVALANMLMGVFVVPGKIHFILNPDGENCNLALGWIFVANYYQSSVSLMAVLSLVFERFLYVYTEKKQMRVRPWARRVISACLFVMPWILSILLLLPTFLGGLISKATVPGNCLYIVNDDFFLAAQLLSFIPASLVVVILAPFTGLLDCLRPQQCLYRPLTPKGETLAVTAVISFLSIFCEAPYCVVRVLMMRLECNNTYCYRLNEALTVTMWIRILKAAVFPLIWLLYTDIRVAMNCGRILCPKTEEHDTEDDSDEEELKELKE